MEVLVLLFLGIIGFLLLTSSIIATRTRIQGVEIALALIATLVWVVFAMGATNVESRSFCCDTASSEPAVAAIGLVFAGTSLLAALYGPEQLLPTTQTK